MASELKFLLSLEDRMSKPAHEASMSLKELSGGLLRTVEPAEVMRHAFEATGEGLRSFASGLKSGEAQEAVEGLTSVVAGLAQALDLVVPGLGQLASAEVKIVGGVAGLTVGLAQSAFELADKAGGARETALALFDALGDGPEAGQKTLNMLDDMSERLPQSRKQLAEWTKTFEALGITDLDQLKGQLAAVGSLQATLGDEGAAKYMKLTRSIQDAVQAHHGLGLSAKEMSGLGLAGARVNVVAKAMGLSADVLRAQLKAGTADATEFGAAMEGALIKQGARPLATLGDQLATVLAKGKESFGKLFDSDSINFKPLTESLQAFFAVFDDSDAKGSELKDGITGGLNGIISGLGDVTEEAEHLFLTLEIAALENKDALLAMWDTAKTDGRLFLDIVDLVVDKLVLGVDTALKLAGLLAKAKHALTPDQGVMLPRAPRGRGDDQSGDPASIEAPAHARGGLVMRPAAGEVFASVAPGERIIPANQNGGGGGVTIERLDIHITAPNGVTDAAEMSASALSRALERYQLQAGR